MAEYCGQCSKERGFPPETWEHGDFGHLLDELRDGSEETVLCQGCGWLVVRKVGRQPALLVFEPAEWLNRRPS